MVDGYNYLEGTQIDINRRLLRKIQALEKATGIDVKDIDDLQEVVGDEDSGLVKDVADIQTAIGDGDSGLVKDVADIKTAVGNSDSGLTKDVADIKTAIGDEDTASSILGRIKALEDA